MDSSEQLPAPEREILQGGPVRASLLTRLSPRWRRHAMVLIAFVLGVTGGLGANWWNDQSQQARAPSPPGSPGMEVRLVLSGVVPAAQPSRTVGDGPLRLDAALLHSRGPGTATVTKIHRDSGSLAIRAPALPVELSANHSFARVRLFITPRDCGLAAEWTPSAQPFTLTWRDDHGDIHQETGGDHDASMELTLIRYFDAVCPDEATTR